MEMPPPLRILHNPVDDLCHSLNHIQPVPSHLLYMVEELRIHYCLMSSDHVVLLNDYWDRMFI